MKNNFNNNKVLTLFRNDEGIFFKYNVLSVALSNLLVCFMARSKRIALTLDAEYHELLKVIADYQGKKVTTVVKDFMNSSRPMAEAMKKAFDDLHAGKDHSEALNELLKSSFDLVKEKKKD